jgi:hypothetical protein
MTISARSAASPVFVAWRLSPLMQQTIRGAYFYKKVYFRVDPLLRRTAWALHARGITRRDNTLHCDVLTPFGEQVRRVVKRMHDATINAEW